MAPVGVRRYCDGSGWCGAAPATVPAVPSQGGSGAEVSGDPPPACLGRGVGPSCS